MRQAPDSPQDITWLEQARHPDPFCYLGQHPGQENHQIIRTFQPSASKVEVLDDTHGKELPMHRASSSGVFLLSIDSKTPVSYRLRLHFPDGSSQEIQDPFSFPPVLTETDLYLFCEGTQLELYRKFGAQIISIGKTTGVHFSVWAPNASRVSVVADFNQWDGRIHPMRNRINAGVWEIFIPDVPVHTHYKFEIRTKDGEVLLKSDPFAFFSQHGLQTASLVYDLSQYKWNDDAWMEKRLQAEPHREPISIYEMHPGSWARVPDENNRWLTWSELGERLIPYVKELGFTHIELMGVAEHPFDGSWGYQVTGYYAPTSRFGSPDDFRAFIDLCHQNGIGVLMDWVPAHFPKDAHGLARFDGSHLYEHADPRQGEHQDWGTLIFNYDRHEVRNFLIANALFWLDQYHIDGLRVDAVASMLYLDYSRENGAWIPNIHGGRENLGAIQFLKELNEHCYARFPGILTMAEESTAWQGVTQPTYLGGLGFGFKWNMGWMNDSLQYIEKDPVHRCYHHGDMTFSLIYAFHENFILVLSHDEVVHGKNSLIQKMPGDLWQKFANLRLFFGWMFLHPGKKLLFQGGEFAQFAEWNHNQSLDWHLLSHARHQGISRLIADLNALYRREPSLHESDHDSEGFEWIDLHDSANSVFSFLRKSRSGSPLVVLLNATPVVRDSYRVGVPLPGFYQEVLNTDSALYDGSNVGNLGGSTADPIPWQGQAYSIEVVLPPLGAVVFRPEPDPSPDAPLK